MNRSLGHDCCVLLYNTSASVGWWRGIKSITWWWWWICWVMNSWTTWHDSNWSWLRIRRVRACYIDICSGNDSRGCWCNSDVAWTITIAIVPPENKHNDTKCYKSEPAKLDYKLHFSEQFYTCTSSLTPECPHGSASLFLQTLFWILKHDVPYIKYSCHFGKN